MNENVVVSYSKYSTWQQCQLKYKYLYIDKLKEAPSLILEHGNQVHKQMEEYLKLPSMPMPDCVHENLRHMVNLIKQTKPEVEGWWTLDKDLNPCGSWDANVAYRSKIDFYYIQDKHLVIGDWKTGKVRPKNLDQLQFYAFNAFRLFPEIETITLELYYLEHGVYITEEFKKSQTEHLEMMWNARLEPFKKAIIFPPNPTALCGYCSFARSKGGPCLAS